MPRFLSQSSILVAILLVCSGCTRSGDWPNLSDKMPDPAERNRVIERADPSSEPRPVPQAIVSEQDATQLLADTIDAVANAETNYEVAMQTWQQSEDEIRTSWMGAQLAVTRLSQTVSRLDEILFSQPLAGTATKETAAKLKERVDAIVITARQELAANEPN